MHEGRYVPVKMHSGALKIASVPDVEIAAGKSGWYFYVRKMMKGDVVILSDHLDLGMGTPTRIIMPIFDECDLDYLSEKVSKHNEDLK